MYDTNGAKRTLTGAVSMPLSSSYHVVLVYDATAGRFALYVNGVNITSSAPTPNANVVANSSPLYLFGYASGVASMNGVLDEVALYNTALTDYQVQCHYAIGTGNPKPPVAVSVPPAAATGAHRHRPSW